MDDLPQLLVPDVGAFGAWLADHHADPTGVWLVLAKKGTTEPTSLTYDQALDQALRWGWIDGQVRRIDAATYRQRWMRRRARSVWSQRNVGFATRLIEQGLMQPPGLVEMILRTSGGKARNGVNRSHDGLDPDAQDVGLSDMIISLYAGRAPPRRRTVGRCLRRTQGHPGARRLAGRARR